ncbi:MAG: hypothetical protein U9R00_00055 [Patescibacteria group bacterium]|nr:hypothetical protein [Patescibacteria group bacterium]
MVNKFTKSKVKNNPILKKLCPFCLGNINNSEHNDCFPKGKIIIKKENYLMIKVSKNESIIKRMLNICDDINNNSEKFFLFYVDMNFIGYKSKNKIKFVPGYSDEKYKNIFKEYIPKSERQKNNFVFMRKNRTYSTSYI